jgi:hypothetical protein
MAGEIQSSAGSMPVIMFPAQSQSYSTSDWENDSKIEELSNQITKLTEQVNKLERTISQMGVMMNGLPIGFHVVNVNDKSLGETKNMIIDFYQAHRGNAIYPDDVANELGLDLKITMQAVKELMREGKIEEVN